MNCANPVGFLLKVIVFIDNKIVFFMYPQIVKTAYFSGLADIITWKQCVLTTCMLINSTFSFREELKNTISYSVAITIARRRTEPPCNKYGK